MIARVRLLAALAALLFVPTWAVQPSLLPIGAIQGAENISPYLNRFVNFRGVVVGRYEDQNTRGDVYYTLFVQDLPDANDGDPATSDGIAVFLGRQPRDDVPLGATVLVGGKVTEFYGLTEMDDKGLVVTVEEPTGALPPPVSLDSPAEMDAAAAYFESLEGMRVAYDGAVVVAGPTHEGCGFAVIAAMTGDGELAARLLGAVDSIAGEIGARRLPHQALRKRAIALTQAMLDESVLLSAWNAGRGSSLAEAIVEAETVQAIPSAGMRDKFTPRELDVLSLLVTGETDRTIGNSLFISTRTVESHVANIFAKLGVHSRAAATATAVAAGIVEPRVHPTGHEPIPGR